VFSKIKTRLKGANKDYEFKIKKPKKNWWYITCSVLAIIMALALLYLKVK